MTQVKFEVAVPAAMASVITTESAEDRALAVGDEARLVVTAIHVLPVED
jgi:molybdate transport system regulatory protein